MEYKLVHKCFECDALLRERVVTEERFMQTIDRIDGRRYICEDEEPVVGATTITFYSSLCEDCREDLKRERELDSFSW